MKEEPGTTQFFVTPEHTCSYLPRRNARTMFLDPRESISTELYQTLTHQGFRRSGSHLYKPACSTCKACTPVRVVINDFIYKKSDRKILRLNKDLTIRTEEAKFNSSYYQLYAEYISYRHADGDMYPPSRDQFKSFLLTQWANSFFLCLYSGKELLSVAVTDKLKDGLSAIYTFFSPKEPKRSLGNFSILNQIDLCKSEELDFLYLGYWIRNSKKMAYKNRYKPIHAYENDKWVARK